MDDGLYEASRAANIKVAKALDMIHRNADKKAIVSTLYGALVEINGELFAGDEVYPETLAEACKETAANDKAA
jgi:hypothetical protein